MPPQASFVLFERSGGRARRPWRTSACFLLPTGSRPGIGTYAQCHDVSSWVAVG